MAAPSEGSRVTVAGASGFVGGHLLERLSGRVPLRALSRSEHESSPTVEWAQVDLFSFQSTREALRDTDVAIYLVHSMLPSSRLFQGNFQDTDLFLADNFARACVANGVRQIIYLGGLVPEENISKHLASRKEVEEVFEATGIPVTVLRAGMVVGDGGSSFEILENLVLNLPVMILPSWTTSNTQAVYIDDLTAVIAAAVDNADFKSKTIDVVNGERITYEQLIRQTCAHLERTPPLVPVPVNYLGLSKLWVRLFGRSDAELVSPLIDSLQCDLPGPPVPDLLEDLIVHRSYQDMLAKLSSGDRKGPRKRKPKARRAKRSFTDNTVRSIQRLANPHQLSEGEVSDAYLRWLPSYLANLMYARTEGKVVRFFARGMGRPLLELTRIDEVDALERVKFHITGGILSKTHDTGWLEFRRVSGGVYTLASINEYIPSLPWFIYRFSQAPFHALVMRAFGEYLRGDPASLQAQIGP